MFHIKKVHDKAFYFLSVLSRVDKCAPATVVINSIWRSEIATSNRFFIRGSFPRLMVLESESDMETRPNKDSISDSVESGDVKPSYRDIGTQRDFRSKEESFFVPKQCYSGSEESETEIDDDGKKLKDDIVVETISKNGDQTESLHQTKEIKDSIKSSVSENELSSASIESARVDEKEAISSHCTKTPGNQTDDKNVGSTIQSEEKGEIVNKESVTECEISLCNMSCAEDASVSDKESVNENSTAEGGPLPQNSDSASTSDKVTEKEVCLVNKQPEKRKLQEESEALNRELKKAKLETKALKAKRPGFTDERYNETSYYIENGLRKVYPYYFTFTTFTKGRWVGEKILDVFAREFRAHPPQEYERCIKSGTLTVNYEKVDIDYKLKHNDLLANVVHRHEVPVSAEPIRVVHLDEDIVVVNKPASIPVHPCGRYRHNTVVFILAKEYQLKNLRTIHRLDRLTSGLLLFGRTPKKARQMEQQIRNRMVQKEYVCRVDGHFPSEVVHCSEPIEVVSYKIGVCKVSPKGKECTTTFHKLGFNPETNTSVVLCQPHTGRMHQIRVHLQYLGYPVVNDPLYNHEVFGPERGRGGNIGKTDEQLIRDLISIHNAENWLGMDGDSDPDLFKPSTPIDEELEKGGSRECSPEGSPPPAPLPVTTLPPAALPPHKVTVATQTGHETPDLTFDPDKLTTDPHCYECKVRYRDPKPRDLVMYLHAFKYQGPGWSYQTELPEWARVDWVDSGD